MIILKTARDIDKLKESGSIVSLVLKEIENYIKPGIQTKELDKIAEDLIISKNAIAAFKNYRGFPSCICVSINEEAIHGIPGDRVLLRGDIVTVDVGVLKNGFYGDAAVTVSVGSVKKNVKELLTISKKCLYNAIDICRKNFRTGDIGNIIEKTALNHGFKTMRGYGGHGVGKTLHEKPFIPNYGEKGKGTLLKPGMVLAIEPILCIGNNKTEIKKDGWTVITQDKSLTAHFEHTVMITEDSAVILTS